MFKTYTIFKAKELAKQLTVNGKPVPPEVAHIASQPLPPVSGQAFRWQNS